MTETGSVAREIAEALLRGDAVASFCRAQVAGYLERSGRHARNRKLLRDALSGEDAAAEPIHVFFLEGADVRVATCRKAGMEDLVGEIEEALAGTRLAGYARHKLPRTETDWTVVEWFLCDVVDRARARRRNARRREARRVGTAERKARHVALLRSCVAGRRGMCATAG